MPNQLIDLFIQLCLLGNGTLSMKKRSAYCDFLSDAELSAKDEAVRDSYVQGREASTAGYG